MMMAKDEFPSNVPPKLIDVYFELGGVRKLAKNRGVAPAHISKLFNDGIEPKDPKIRLKLFLKKKYRKPLPAWVQEAVQKMGELEDRALSERKQFISYK